MTWVACDKADCIHATDTGCSRDSIDINQDGECMQCRIVGERIIDE